MWAQIVNALLGVWLMASPGIFGFESTIADNDHIVGPVIASFAIISWWEATRTVRLFNLIPAAWLVLAPWVLGYENTTAVINDMAVGVLVIAFAMVKGKVEGTFGGGWKAVWHSDTLHEREARTMQDYESDNQ